VGNNNNNATSKPQKQQPERVDKFPLQLFLGSSSNLLEEQLLSPEAEL